VLEEEILEEETVEIIGVSKNEIDVRESEEELEIYIQR